MGWGERRVGVGPSLFSRVFVRCRVVIAAPPAPFRWPNKFAKAWAELGNLYLEMDRRAEADAAYRRGIALGRTDLRDRLSNPGG